MTLQWAENELRRGASARDIEQADQIKLILEERGKDIPLPGSKKHYPHGREGRREYIDEIRHDGSTVRVPKALYEPERLVLEIGLEKFNLNPNNPYFHAKDIKAKLEHLFAKNSTKSGSVYKLIGRLIDWGYLNSHWEDFPATNSVTRRRVLVITETGIDRIKSKLAS